MPGSVTPAVVSQGSMSAPFRVASPWAVTPSGSALIVPSNVAAAVSPPSRKRVCMPSVGAPFSVSSVLASPAAPKGSAGNP
jgi:hypothetical protein